MSKLMLDAHDCAALCTYCSPYTLHTFQTFTPEISRLADDGIWFSNYYAQPLCTPSRAALMTGRYPTHVGICHGIITGNTPWGLPTNYSLMPEYLKEVGGYRTHLVGKWHLGHFHESHLVSLGAPMPRYLLPPPHTHTHTRARARTHTPQRLLRPLERTLHQLSPFLSTQPLERGFDTFYGFYSGFTGAFHHTSELTACAEERDCYYDLRDGWEPAGEALAGESHYNMYLFEDEVAKIINHYGESDESTPFFLYYAMSNVHEPIEVPEAYLEREEVIQKLADIPNVQRRHFAAMTMIVDDAVQNLTSCLRSNELYDETIIIIASDNGAASVIAGSGSNLPLRGMKGYLWEGGVRVHAMVRSSSIPTHLRGKTYDGLFHVTDWMPTIFGMIGSSHALKQLVPSQAGGYLDGYNHWGAILAGHSRSPRSTLLHNLDYLYSNVTSEWYTTGAIRSGDFKLLRGVQYLPVWELPQSENRSDYEAGGVYADGGAGGEDWYNTVPTDYLYNVTADPTETTDLKAQYPEIFAQLNELMDEYVATMAPTAYCGSVMDKQARKVFNETQFIGPWVTEDDFVCPKGNYSSTNATYDDQLSEEEQDAMRSAVEIDVSSALQFMAQYTAEMCLYHLLPDSAC